MAGKFWEISWWKNNWWNGFTGTTFSYEGNLTIAAELSSIYREHFPVLYSEEGNIPFGILPESSYFYLKTYPYNGNIITTISLNGKTRDIHVYLPSLSNNILLKPRSEVNFLLGNKYFFRPFSLDYFQVEKNSNDMDSFFMTSIEDQKSASIYGTFRTFGDKLSLKWKSLDFFKEYEEVNDLNSLKLSFYFLLSEEVLPIDSTSNIFFVLTDKNDNTYSINLRNYIFDRPLDNWEIAHGLFPKNRIPGTGDGSSGNIFLDFSNLYLGENPEDPNWEHLNIEEIEVKEFSFNFYPLDFNDSSGFLPFSEVKPFEISFSAWDTTDSRVFEIKKQSGNIGAHLEDLDVFSSFTPKRIINFCVNSGFRDMISIFLGSSLWYNKIPVIENGNFVLRENGHYLFKLDLDEETSTLNSIKYWLRNFIEYAYEFKGFRNIKIFIPVAIKDCPLSWLQRTYNQEPNINYLLSPTNPDVIDFFKGVLNSLKFISEEIPYFINIYRPEWGHVSYSPTFYDESTRNLFYLDFEEEIPEFPNIYSETNFEILEWFSERWENFLVEVLSFENTGVVVEIENFKFSNNILHTTNNIENFILNSPKNIVLGNSRIGYKEHGKTENILNYISERFRSHLRKFAFVALGELSVPENEHYFRNQFFIFKNIFFNSRILFNITPLYMDNKIKYFIRTSPNYPNILNKRLVHFHRNFIFKI